MTDLETIEEILKEHTKAGNKKFGYYCSVECDDDYLTEWPCDAYKAASIALPFLKPKLYAY